MDSTPVERLTPRTLWWRGTIGLFTLLALAALAGALLRHPLETVGEWFVHHLGLIGVFVTVLVIDTMPLTHEPILLLAWTGGLGFLPIWLTAGLASILSGALGWFLGSLFAHNAFVQRQCQRYRIDILFQRYGVWAVAIAAITPFPYAIATWSAGAARMPFLQVLAGSCARLIKVLIYLSLIVAGWQAGA